jgi:hypothetical protein
MQNQDVQLYSQKFINDGFDSLEMLAEVVEEDLYFMKKAHSRALGRRLELTSERKREAALGVVDALASLNLGEGKNVGGDVGAGRGVEVIARRTQQRRQQQQSVEQRPLEKRDGFDITKRGFAERSSKSLSTTLPPMNPGVNSNPPPSSNSSEDEKFYDITQNMFPERPRSSLSTTAFPSAFHEGEKSEMNSRPAPPSVQNAEVGSRKAATKARRRDDSYVDITQSHFTSVRPTSLVNTGTEKRGVTTSGSDKESKRVYTKIKQKPDDEECIGEECWDITQQHFGSTRPTSLVNTGTLKRGTTAGSDVESRRESSRHFASGMREGERSEMNSRPPPASVQNAGVSGSAGTVRSQQMDGNSHVDIAKQFASDRPTMLVNTGTKKRGTTFGSDEDSRGRRGSWSPDEECIIGDEEVCFDITKQHFDYSDRPTLLVNTGTKKKGTTAGSWDESRVSVRTLQEGDRMEYADKTKGGWRKRIPNDKFLDLPEFSTDLSPPAVSRAVRSGSSAHDDRHPLSLTAHTGANRFKTGEKISTNVAIPTPDRQPLSLTIHSGVNRFKTAERVNTGVSPPTAKRQPISLTVNAGRKVKNITKVPTLVADDQYVDTVTFSSVLTKPSKVKNVTNSILPEEEYVDNHQFSPIPDLSPPSKVKNLRKPQSIEADYVDEFRFSPPTTSSAKPKPTHSAPAAISSDPYVNVPHFSSVSELTPPSKVKTFTSIEEERDEKSVLADDDIFASKPSDVPSPAKVNDATATTDATTYTKAIEKEEEFVQKTRSVPTRIDGLSYEEVESWLLSRLSYNLKPEELDAYSLQLVEDGFDSKDMLDELEEEDLHFMSAQHKQALLFVEVLKDWLLSHLPDLQRDDVATYTMQLIEDGFDSLDMLAELTEDDLQFMKRAHRRVLAKKLHHVAESTEPADGLGNVDSRANASLESAMDEARKELEDKESWIAEQNRLAEQRHLERKKAESAERYYASKGLDGFEGDITQGTFAGRSSKSLATPQSTDVKRTVPSASAKREDVQDKSEADPSYDITRDSFQTRPSLAADPNHHETPVEKVEISDKSNAAASLKGKESSFDITRNSFPKRPSLAADPNHLETPTERANTRHKSAREEDNFSFDISSFPDRPSLSAAPGYHLSPSLSERRDQRPKDPTKVDEVLPGTEGAPRAELYQSYLKRGFTTGQAQELKHFFTVWTDDALPHEKKFTCIFTCPIDGEHFASGNWNHGGEVVQKDGVFWFPNKNSAMHAAAAKALDCFSLRRCKGTDVTPSQRCEDGPYLAIDAPLIAGLPSDVELPNACYRLEDESE